MTTQRRQHQDAPRPTATADAADVPDLGTLLDQAAQDETAAVEQIYDELAGVVLGLATRILRNHAIAEEVTQDVFVEVWRTASRYDAKRGSGKAWILTIAHRRAVDRVRRERSAADRDELAASRTVDRSFDSVWESVETNFVREQVRRCLKALTPAQRESLLLAYYDGHTYREVASLLNTPLGTVKTRMRDGLNRLRNCMRPAQ